MARDGARGQTSIDFLVGVSVFLLAIGFVMGVVPGMIDPFTDAQEAPLVGDRVASQLTEGMLADPERPNTLDETCTFAFFDSSLGDGAGCPISFDETESDLAARLEIDSVYRVNVTIRRNVTGDADRDVLCTDGDDVGACSGAGLSTELAIGEVPPETASVVSARRVGYLDGKDVTVVVKLW